MKERIFQKWNYLLSGFLGFWGLAFMATSGLISKTAAMGVKTLWASNVYSLLRFGWGGAASAAAIFYIFMILISVALLVLGIVQVLKLHGLKIPYLDKIYEIKVMKKFDIATLLVACYVLFSLIAIICLAAFGSQKTTITNSNIYYKVKVGFGPVWLFLSSAIILAAILFKDKLIPLLLKEKPVKDASIAEKTTKVEKKVEKKDVNKETAKKVVEEKVTVEKVEEEKKLETKAVEKKESKPIEKKEETATTKVEKKVVPTKAKQAPKANVKENAVGKEI